MSMCHGCGGAIGRDCFNPQECEEITRSMANQYSQASQEIAELLAECDRLRSEVGKLRVLLLGVLENDTLSAGLSVLDDEMRQRIRDGLSWKIE
jgi:dihydrodipicolinate synthase/N-acetylneuraminate lyase